MQHELIPEKNKRRGMGGGGGVKDMGFSEVLMVLKFPRCVTQFCGVSRGKVCFVWNFQG